MTSIDLVVSHANMFFLIIFRIQPELVYLASSSKKTSLTYYTFFF